MSDLKKTVLFDKHIALAGRSHIAAFAGWLMPLWYKSISIEHKAVRTSAGLFDCTHMGVLQIAGKNAQQFLNILATNDVSTLKTGRAQYSYILDLAGNIIDDIIIYCLGDDNYMVVVNAANEQKVKDWINEVGSANILNVNRLQVEVKDLKDETLPDAMVDIALQGPASIECLKDIFNIDIDNLKSFLFTRAKANGIDVIVSRTGYTGAKAGFEIFVHPDKAAILWDLILQKGSRLGIIACGLGARDSLRIEAGLPLYGHELAGPFNISPFQAGYGWAVKLQKENFIGKDAILEKSTNFRTEVARLKFDGGSGIRPVRQFDAVLDTNGVCIGYILSCANINNAQIALALIEKQHHIVGNPIGLYYVARNKNHIQQGRLEKVNIGDKLFADIAGKVIERFERF